MTFILVLIIGGLAAALYHSSTIAEQKIKGAEEALQGLRQLQIAYDELADAYRDCMESCQEDPDSENPEYC